MSSSLNREEQEYLLKLARQTLTMYLENREISTIEPKNLSSRLQEKRACFVTYTKNEDLRGCIGSIYPDRVSYQEVMRRAIDGALRDPRFPAVEQTELDQLNIEISVLSLIQEVNRQEFIPGEHGIIIEQQGKRAVYLPQVAEEQGWNSEQTFQSLCRKAGLTKDAWKNSHTRFFIFTAQVFSE